MGNGSSTKYTDTFLEIACGESQLADPYETFVSIATNISRNTLHSVRNARGEGVVACACYNKDIRYLQYLITNKFPCSNDNHNNNPLHTAVILENTEAVMLVCKKWQELISSTNNSGQSPLDITTSPGIRKVMIDASTRAVDPLNDADIPEEMRPFFIHPAKIKSRTLAPFSGGQSTIFIADLLSETSDTKVVLKGICQRLDHQRSLLRELKILLRISSSHPNIIHMLGFTIYERNIFLISPYTAFGDLDMWIRKNQEKYTIISTAPPQIPTIMEGDRVYTLYTISDPSTQELIVSFIRQITLGIDFLHKQNIIHNDIKPSNCLLFIEGETIIIKLIDFGLSVLEEDPEFMNTPLMALGTELFQAPERFVALSRMKVKPSIKTDMFEFGATIWYLINGRRPFYPIPRRTKNHVLPKVPSVSYIQDSMIEFINKCISHDPLLRPTSFDTLHNVERTPSDEFSSSGEDERADSVVIDETLYHIPTPDDHILPIEDSGHSSLLRQLSGDLTIITPSEVTQYEVIGEGNFGKVFKGKYKERVVAIKVLKCTNSFSSDEMDSIRSEFIKESMALSKIASTQRTSKIVGIILEPMQIVMEYYPKKSIRDVLREEGNIHYMTKLSLIKDIAEGLVEIHQVWGVHRDIAARNILVDDDYRAYISDFGKTRFVDAVTAATTLDNIVAVKWASPETFFHPDGRLLYSKYSDIWALGVTIYEILVGCEPYADLKHHELMKILKDKRGVFLRLPDTFDDVLIDTVNKCLSWNPEDRGDATFHFNILSEYIESLVKERKYHGRKNTIR